MSNSKLIPLGSQGLFCIILYFDNILYLQICCYVNIIASISTRKKNK